MKSLAWIGVLIFSFSALAGDIEWGGRYRVEGVSIRNTNLQSGGFSKAYMLHHLLLEPKIVATDGVNIYGSFGVLNNNRAFHNNSQMGDFMGNGPNSSGSTSGTTNASNSNSLSQTQTAETIRVHRLYLVWTQEFATLMVGRAPVQFGLGISHNAGLGEFDHWYDSKDLVAYKILMGNMSLTPMMGKVNEGSLNQEDDVNDYMIHFQYDNPDTKLSMGVFYEVRVATKEGGNDAPTSIGGAGATLNDSWEGKQLNLFVAKRTDEINFGLEAAFQNGSTGVQPAAGGGKTSLEGFGIAAEFEYSPLTSSLGYGLKAGIATGDDPNTNDKYEGFIFDRNYNVGFILFNHYVGNYDVLRTSLVGKSTDPHKDTDTEALSNVFYLAPSVTYDWSENWASKAKFIWATLNQNPLTSSSGEVDKGLGSEIDVTLDWRPSKQIIWGVEAGLLFPGDAFKGGNNKYPTDSAFGIQTKAAVSF